MGTEKIINGPGLVHIYHGGGKGKTTAAVGQMIRAAGFGFRVLFFQFLKDGSSSERKVLEKIPQIDCMEGAKEVKFTFRMTEKEKEDYRSFYLKKLQDISEKLQKESFDMAVLDEAVYAVQTGMLEEDALLLFLEQRPEGVEIILTGSEPGERLTAAADYVTEMRMEKHPYTRGQAARGGIEC